MRTLHRRSERSPKEARDARARRAHVHRHQGEDLEDARPGRGSGRDPRLRLPEAGRAAPERQEGHRRRRHGQEAPADAVARSSSSRSSSSTRRRARRCRRAARTSPAWRSSARPLAQTELQSLDTQINELEGQQEKLTENEQKLRTKIEAFRTKKEVIKAQYSAAEAQVKISEAASGVGEEMADLGLAMQRAEDKTETMRARAGAVEELEAAGTFDDITQLGSRPGRHRARARTSSRAAPRSTTSWPR